MTRNNVSIGSTDLETVDVDRHTALSTAFNQYKESDGNTHLLRVTEDNRLVVCNEGNILDDDKISAYRLFDPLEYTPDSAHANDFELLEVADTVEIGGQEYDIQMF